MALVAVGVAASLLWGLPWSAPAELDGTEGLVETVGEVDTGLRGTVRYRIFRHPESEPDPATASQLRRVVSRPEATLQKVKAVLDRWVVRCKTEYREPGEPPTVGLSHWGWVEFRGDRKAMQVVTSLNGSRVASVYMNRNATKALRRGNQGWFEARCIDPPQWRYEHDA